MPTYVFKCKECNEVFEVLYKNMSTPPSHKCKCGAEAKRTPTSIRVKYVGRGWAGVEEQTEKRLNEATSIAEHSYEKRAEQNSPKLSEQDDFWQDLAKTVGE